MSRQKIILDLDNALTIPVQDTDDAMALALALLSPEIDLLGCTTCAGNCRTWQSTENTLRLLQIAGRTDVPVAVGRETPLLADVEPSLRYLEQKTAGPERVYWDDVPSPPRPTLAASPLKAYEFIIETVQKYPGEVTLVQTGSLTNLALALLVAPEIAPQVKEVVHMGGSFGDYSWSEEGTADIPGPVWRDVLRFNTEFDPLATEIVIRSGVPFTFITSNVTSQVFQYAADVKRIEAAGSPLHHHLYTYGMPWVEWSVHERKLPGAHMHDTLTLAVVIDRSFCTFRPMHCDLARFRAREHPYLVPGEATPQVWVAVTVDKARFERWCADRLASPFQLAGY